MDPGVKISRTKIGRHYLNEAGRKHFAAVLTCFSSITESAARVNWSPPLFALCSTLWHGFCRSMHSMLKKESYPAVLEDELNILLSSCFMNLWSRSDRLASFCLHLLSFKARQNPKYVLEFKYEGFNDDISMASALNVLGVRSSPCSDFMVHVSQTCEELVWQFP